MIVTILSIVVNGLIVVEMVRLIQMFMTINLSFLNPVAMFFGYKITDMNTPYIVASAFMAVAVSVSLTTAVDTILRFFYGFRKPLKDETDKLYKLFASVCQGAGKKPEDYHLYIIDEKYPNAYAVGRNSVAVTRSLLNNCTDKEIMGVLGHELGHLHYGDTMKSRVVLTVSIIGQGILIFYHVIAAILGGLSRIPIPFINLLLMVIGWVFRLTAYVYQFLLLLPLSIGAMFGCRQNEYRADKYAHSIGQGEGLKSLLYRLLDDEREPPHGLLNFLHRTHPAVGKRIGKLEVKS